MNPAMSTASCLLQEQMYLEIGDAPSGLERSDKD